MPAHQVMLATTIDMPPELAAGTLTGTGRWVAELKLDGIRAVATIDGASVTLHNRRGADITHRYPDVVQALGALGVKAVLDGEIVVMRGERTDFSAVLRRDAQTKPREAAMLARVSPATFVAFDVLFLNGIDVRDLTYDRRRVRLDGLDVLYPGLRVNPSYEDGQAMWGFVVENKLEGLVLKRRDSKYRGRRDPAWVKVKALKRISALVKGYEAGKGHRASTFGALRLALLEGDQFVDIGSVGTGFTNDDLTLIWGRITSGNEPIIVEVEFMELQPGGHLRQPSFKGLRDDVDVTDCTFDQLRIGSQR